MSLEAALAANTAALQAMSDIMSSLLEKVGSGASWPVVETKTRKLRGTSQAEAAKPVEAITQVIDTPVVEVVDKETGEITTVEKSAPVVEQESTTAPVEQPSAAAGATAMTYDDLKVHLMGLVRAKNAKVLGILLAEFGVTHGDQIKPVHYPAVLARVEELKNV